MRYGMSRTLMEEQEREKKERKGSEERNLKDLLATQRTLIVIPLTGFPTI